MTVLKEIMDAAPPLADLYSAPITNVLLDLLRNADAEDVTVLGLEVVRQLAKYAGNSLRANAMDFVELASTALRDQASAQKRRTAVLALTEIVAQTACMGDMVEHRDDYIDALIGHLALETEPTSRRDVVRALGTIGALKPANSALDIADKLVQELADSPEAASSADHLEAGLIPLDEGVVRVRVPLYIADWVLAQLMEIWNEPFLKLHHARVSSLLYIYSTRAHLPYRCWMLSSGSSVTRRVVNDPGIIQVASSRGLSPH
jgi:FKBP12-rapamycin complex-associated protein